MKLRFIWALVLSYFFSNSATEDKYLFLKNSSDKIDAEWTIIGAGPAGIITVGLLLDLGISPDEITWIDPEFNVGRLGAYYESVPANTKNKLFISFLQSCKTFLTAAPTAIETLSLLELEKEYPLKTIIDPLREISAYLKTKIKTITGTLHGLSFDDHWIVNCLCSDASRQLKSKHVVLATGSHPKTLDYPCEMDIPLDIALDKERLEQQMSENDSVAVIGSSHSAILILKYLTELKVKRIINFYKNPLLYAVDMGTWLLHNASGLKGITAEWAREVLEKNPPANLIRIYNSKEAREAWLPICNKKICAVGYERNDLPLIDDKPISYDDKTGIIAPGLFGIGLAFPEQYTDPLGNVEHRVGLNSFMDYAQRVVPQWLHSAETRSRFASFEQLFTIELL